MDISACGYGGKCALLFDADGHEGAWNGRAVVEDEWLPPCAEENGRADQEGG